MFNLVRKNLTFSAFITTSVHRLFPRSSYSSQAASVNSFAVSFLIDSSGSPPDKPISASNYLLMYKTSNRAYAVIAFFKKQLFTETQISNLIRKNPKLLTYHPRRNLLPKVKFFSSIGLSISDICKLLTAKPNLIGRSLKTHLEPTYNSLRDLFQCNDRTLMAIRRCPFVLDRDFQATLIANMQTLHDVGVPASKLLYLLINQPRLLLVTTDKFKKAVEEVVEMGFDPLKIPFTLAVHLLRSMEAYKKWGWSEAQILLAFRNSPWCMAKSVDKIDEMMDFLVNKMGFETSIIAKKSVLFSYSLEKRIIPRGLVYQYCLDNGLMNDKSYCGFTSWLKCSENMFIRRLEKYEKEAPGVLKFYQEKLDLAN